MSKKLDPCPVCGSRVVTVVKAQGQFYGHCHVCTENGPKKATAGAAAESWNAHRRHA